MMLNSMSTPQLIDGDHFSCVALAWQAHEGELRGYLRHQLADTDAADDVLQDVFVKAVNQGQGFCTVDNPRAWLFQVARNVLVDRARRTRPVEPLSDELEAPEPESTAAVDELTGCLSRCMDALSAEDAEILRSCDLEGQTTRAFAAARNLTLSAAKSRLLRARQRLRAQLTNACQVRFDADGSVDGHIARSSG
jgi:RNA polymerase sigma-70 factor (ECF subfamily)